jgi:hypothetical protein
VQQLHAIRSGHSTGQGGYPDFLLLGKKDGMENLRKTLSEIIISSCNCSRMLSMIVDVVT